MIVRRLKSIAIRSHAALPCVARLSVLAIALLPLSQVDEYAQAVNELAPVPRQSGTATLRDRLVYGLKARLPSEVAFVELVVVRVRTGRLPERLVNETFFWAREHSSMSDNGRPVRPIIYFQPALKLRAQKIGVPL